MTDEKIKLIIGSLLHDIGKVVYREGMIEKSQYFRLRFFEGKWWY